MDGIRHYLKPVRKNGAAYNTPWGPAKTHEVVVPEGLPKDMKKHFRSHHHCTRFNLGGLTFLSASELQTDKGGEVRFAILSGAFVYYLPETDAVRVEGTPGHTNVATFLRSHRPCWSDESV